MPGSDGMGMDPTTLRDQIPALDETIYLNTGASGPVPEPVLRAAKDRLHTQAVAAPAAGRVYEEADHVYETARERIASHLAVPASTIGLVESTADGLGAVAAAMDWSPGDVIVRTDTEHPAGILPWARLKDRFDVEIRVLETEQGRIDPEAFTDAVADATAVCLSSICWQSGVRRPVASLAEIAAETNTRVIVDAVQSVGQEPLRPREWPVDVLAGSTHKWPLGLWGGGFVYVDPGFAPTLSPPVVGYRGAETVAEKAYTLTDGARRFEVSTSSPLPYAAAIEALEIIEAIGYDTIGRRIDRLTDRLVDQLPPERIAAPLPPETGIVTVTVDDGEAAVRRLGADDIQVRTLPTGDVVRVSVHVFNTVADIDAVAAALAA